MSKKEFWIRLSFYIFFGLIIPGAFLIWRFHLFEKVSSLTIGGWGVVFILFVGIFFIKLMKAIKKGLPFSLFTQCIEGICKVILPLLISLLILYLLQNSIKELMQVLGVFIICEMFAIPLNPLPKWGHINNIKEDESRLKSLFKKG